MTLTLNTEGRLVIENITPEALDYIERERPQDPSETWCFGREIYDGTIYVTEQGWDRKAQVLGMIETLKRDYGMEMTKSAGEIVNAWSVYRLYREQGEVMGERENELKGRVSVLKDVLRHGCSGCANFIYDGDCGRCKADGGELNETPLSFRNGKCDNQGVLHIGSKFYPHEGCMYLNER